MDCKYFGFYLFLPSIYSIVWTFCNKIFLDGIHKKILKYPAGKKSYLNREISSFFRIILKRAPKINKNSTK